MIETFGAMPDGEKVKRLTIGDEGFNASFLTYGATMQSVRMAGVPHSLCLGSDAFDTYLGSGRYMGAVAGRVVNRIGYGRAKIAGVPHAFDRNDRGIHTLHGGAGGIGQRNWAVLNHNEHALDLTITDAEGFNGFPGTMTIIARFRIVDGAALEIALEATTDAPTLCNLAPHPYFNLNGGGDAREHLLRVDATQKVAVDAEKIPTGVLDPISDTVWDHRIARQISENGLAYDHNFCLSDQRQPLRAVAELTGTRSGVTMGVETTEPGLQVYDGSGLQTPYSGVALEPQCWPDAPNHSGFPAIELTPGTISRQVTRFVFSRM